jgi:GTP1/Obg family GTP-binding protein
MKITEVTVHAGRVIPHPFESYANLRPDVTLKAELRDGEDVTTAVKTLQAKAEELVEEHKEHLIDGLRELREQVLRSDEIGRLESMIRTSQQRLEQLRAGNGAAALPERTDDEEIPL